MGLGARPSPDNFQVAFSLEWLSLAKMAKASEKFRFRPGHRVGEGRERTISETAERRVSLTPWRSKADPI